MRADVPRGTLGEVAHPVAATGKASLYQAGAPARGAAMKLAVSGKGGVGKTTIAALLASELAARGYRVTAIDADPNPTLASALGFPTPPTTSLLDLRAEIEERVGGSDGFIRLNPRVDDLVERVAVAHGGIQLIVAGATSTGGAGGARARNHPPRRRPPRG